MSTDRFDRQLPDLLEQLAPRAVPDYRDDIVRQTARTRQRPAWTFPERWLPVSVITSRGLAAPPIRWRVVGLVTLLLLSLAIGLALVAGSERHALPAPFGPAANGLVAYSKGGDIFTVDPATGTRRAIVTGATTDEGPKFSPDGTRLAFLRTTGASSVIVLSDADGRNQVVVSMAPLAGGADMTWSPDGRSIAAVTDDNGDTGSLWMVDTAAGTIRKVNGVVTDYAEVQWRPPDGRQLMVTARVDDRARFALVSAVGDAVEVLVTPDGDAAGGLRPGGWSPDGRRFVYAAQDGQVYVLDMQGMRDVLIRPSLAEDGTGYPRLSNDGRRVLMMEFTNGDPTWLSVAPSDGSAPAVRVSDIYSGGIGTHYQWAPDDSTISLLPNVGPLVLLDPAGAPPSTPPWMTDEVESWQRLAR